MAEQDVRKYTNPENKIKIMIADPNRKMADPVSKEKPTASDPKPSVKQRLTSYAFGKEVDKPAKYVWDSYLEPTGKRVIYDVAEHFIKGILQTISRALFNGKVLEDGRPNYQAYGKNGGASAVNMPKTYKMMAPVKELKFVDYTNALNVLVEMKKIIASEERCVTVGKYYELADAVEEADSTSYTSGWFNLDSVTKPDPAPGGGFVLKLPTPVNLKIR